MHTCQIYFCLCVCGNHNLRVISHSVCRSHTRECHIQTHTCQTVCGNRTLRLEINLLRVEVRFMPVKITLCVEIILCVWNRSLCVEINFVSGLITFVLIELRVEITLCV
jgi:hypothetical protein